MDATRTLKNFEADLLKAREDLKEMTRARDSSMEHMCLGLKLIRHMWEASLLDVRLSKTVRHNQSGQYLLIQYLLIGD